MVSTTPGSRLGPYEIVSRIGAGGMGEVFRAATDKGFAVWTVPDPSDYISVLHYDSGPPILD